MQIPLLDLKREWKKIRKEVIRGWAPVLDSMQLLKGPNVASFEEEMATYLGVKHVIGVASGTDALTLGLIAVDVAPGCEVILPANTFAADVEAIQLAGAIPKLIDINEINYGPNLRQLRSEINQATLAVIVTHLYGAPVELASVLNEAQTKGVMLIEDASHAHGALYRQKKVGGFGKIGCFSCGPIKNLGCYGDGGFIATDDDDVAERVRILQIHGQKTKNNHICYGFNSRLDELQAVVLRAKLKRLDERNAKRREIARRYDGVFQELGLQVIPTLPDRTCVYHQYVVRTSKRDDLAIWLKKRGVGTGIHYPVPLHKQPSWRAGGYGDPFCPVAERVAGEILSLPVWPDMTTQEVDYVIKSVEQFFRKG